MQMEANKVAKNNHSEATEEPINGSTAGILMFLAPSQTDWQEIRPNTTRIIDPDKRKNRK